MLFLSLVIFFSCSKDNEEYTPEPYYQKTNVCKENKVIMEDWLGQPGEDDNIRWHSNDYQSAILETTDNNELNWSWWGEYYFDENNNKISCEPGWVKMNDRDKTYYSQKGYRMGIKYYVPTVDNDYFTIQCIIYPCRYEILFVCNH